MMMIIVKNTNKLIYIINEREIEIYIENIFFFFNKRIYKFKD